MKWPRKTKICGYTVTMELKKRESGYGVFRPAQLNGEVASWLTPQLQATTLLHELLHACWSISDLAARYKNKTEEDVIRTIEPFIYSMLVDNPDLVKFICQSRK